MTSEPPCNSLTDEETVALRKKRSRRVSFADREITSVHIFNRDEDFETPPDYSSSGKEQQHNNDVSEAKTEVLGFFRDLADIDDSKDMSPNVDSDNADDDDVVTARKSFLRPIESPSPGSSTIVGYATPNDDDFFGPVSASFIRHGTFSDSVASDDNHDVTMDSTAFSMHFRSLARSDSGGSTLIEEKTPLHVTTTSDSGSFMILTKAKKPLPQFSVPVEKASGDRDSNDMSLVGENPRNYDYGKLSPRLEALLAEGIKDVKDVFVSGSTDKKSLNSSEVFMSDENLSGHIDQKDGDKDTSNIDNLRISSVGVSAGRMELDEVNDILSTSRFDQIRSSCLAPRNEDSAPAIQHEIETSNQMGKMNDDCTKYTTGMTSPAVSGVALQSMDNKLIEFNSFAELEVVQTLTESLEETSPKDRRDNYGIYQSSNQLRSPLVGSTSLVNSKQQQLFFNAAKSNAELSYVTPSPKQPTSVLGKENINAAENILSIHKSSSRFKPFEPSPLAHALKDGIGRSKLRLSKLRSSVTSSIGAVAKEICIDIRGNISDAPVINMEKHLFSFDQKNTQPKEMSYIGSAGMGNLKNDGGLNKNEGAAILAEDWGSLIPKPVHILSKERATNPPDNFVSPPSKMLEQKLSSLKEQQHTLYHDVQYDELVSIGLGHDRSSNGNATIASHSTAVLTESEPSSVEGNLDKTVPLATDNILSAGEVSVERNEAFLWASAFPDIHSGALNKSSPMKSPFEKKLIWSPSRKDKVPSDENVQSLAASTLSPNSTSNGPGHVCSHKPDAEIFAEHIENSSARKRRIKESVPEYESHADKIRRINRNPNIHETQDHNLDFLLDCPYGSGNNKKITKNDTAMKHWSDILLKFSTDAHQLVFPLIDKLNIRLIGELQDILAYLQQIKNYETLCSQIRSQKKSDRLGEVRNDRIVEAKMLLYKLAYGKARQQLMSVNREKLLKRAQQLKSVVQKSQMLNLDSKCLSFSFDKGSTSDRNLKFPCRVNQCGKDEVFMDKVAKKKHEFEALDIKIINLNKIVHSYCKIKGEPSCSQTLDLLNGRLNKKISCRFIHEGLQLWVVDGFGSKNGNRYIVLNYHGLLFQRFVITDAVPSIIVSNKLDDLNIEKVFPDMDACVAFACVLNSKTTKKRVGSKSFAQETQITGSLLHNLLDVIGEVQLARVEMRNLVQTNFQSSSVAQLDLHLSFLDLNNGRKVILIIDLTCLNCGVYPLDVVPYQLQASVAGTCMPLPEPQSVKIKAAVDGLRVGYSRIFRLCRCISQVLRLIST